VVPEPKHSKILRFDPGGPSFAMGAFAMLPAISFDNQPRRIAQEICDERANRYLPPKLERRKSSISQHRPKMPFWFRRRFAHRASTGFQGR
jgi:hypothetical protein